ncbi:MAG: imelysin family protein [Pseudomonadota bacterium]
MRIVLAVLAFSFWATATHAQQAPDIEAVVEKHILAGYLAFETATRDLADQAEADCRPDSEPLRAAFHDAFDAWLKVSHLRFGPSEVDNRAFALAFWPDPRSKTRKALARLIANRDAIVSDPAEYKTLSVAARGLYALERLLFDPEYTAPETSEYVCALTRAVATDIASTATEIGGDWRGGFAAELAGFGVGDSRYRTELEALQEVFKALSTGLQFSSEARLGRPLGTFERPRPKRAEMRLSERSQRNVLESLDALQDLSRHLAANEPEIAANLDSAFAFARQSASNIGDDPVFASVSEVQGRLMVEILQQSIDGIREIVLVELGPALGVSKGFNALDGD